MSDNLDCFGIGVICGLLIIVVVFGIFSLGYHSALLEVGVEKMPPTFKAIKR